MDHLHYRHQFDAVINKLNKKPFDEAGLQLWSGIVLNSAAIKAFKPRWSSDPVNALTAEGRIFFSAWVNEQTISEGRLYYNIHALRVRMLKGYKIPARDFADRFRECFQKSKQDWPDVSTGFGPLTLMEGWLKLDYRSIKKDSTTLLHQFLELSQEIDNILELYRVINK